MLKIHHRILPSKLKNLLIKGRGGFRPIILEKIGPKARTRPEILMVVFGPYVQYCLCDATEQ